MSIRMVDHSAPRPVAPKRPGTRARSRNALILAAARATTTVDIAEYQDSTDAVEAFADSVGGRRKLVETLLVADGDAAVDKVIHCLLTPRYAAWPLRRICAHAGITVADLFAAYKKALFVAAHIRAAHLIASKLPPIVEDVLTRALPQQVDCPRCRNTPTTPGTTPCPECLGVGTMTREPDVDRQKLALELGRLTERKGGIFMQQNTAVAAAGAALTTSAPGSLEQLQQAVGDLLFSPTRRRANAPVVDVSPVDPREPPPPAPEPPEEPEDTEDDEDEDDDASPDTP